MTDSSRVIVGVIIVVLSLPVYSQVIASNEDASSDDLNPEFEFEWVSEGLISNWNYPLNKSDSHTQRHPVPIGKPSSISLSPSGNFVVSLHEIGCVSLIWTNGLKEMQVYCHGVNLEKEIEIGQVAISPDESFLAICTQPWHYQNHAQIYTVPVLNYSTNLETRLAGIGLIPENQGHDYSECDDIGFHNKTGNLVALFDKHESLESQGSIEFHEHDLCCSCCDFYVVTNETTGEGYRRAVNLSGFEMDQIGNVTWPMADEYSIWLDTASGNYGFEINNSILQNNPDFLEMMVNSGVVYLNSEGGLSKYTFRMIADSSYQIDNGSNEEISDEAFCFLILIPLFLLFYISELSPDAIRRNEEERKAEEIAERHWRKKERKRKQKLAETRRKNRRKLESRKTKLREIADSVFTSIDDFRIDLDDGELTFSVNGRRLRYEISLNRSNKSIEEEMKKDLNAPMRNYSHSSDGLTIRNIADIATGPFCPNGCRNRLEGGPGGRARWLCINCGFMFDTNGNAL